MKYFLLTLILLTLNIACTVNEQNNQKELESKNLPIQSQKTNDNSSSNLEKASASSETRKDDAPKYLGVTIDEKFGVLESHYSANEKRLKDKKYFVEASGFKVEFNKFTPKEILKNNKSVLSIKTRQHEYAGITVGVADLLAGNSKQIFILGGTGGAVCCSVFWIFDTSNEKVRSIFRSEDYNSYRGEMEVFDAEDDGIYELVLFDSSFRYMLDDCGTCSPEPRAVFKYDEKKKQYFPVKGVQQDFVKEDFKRSEKRIEESYEKLKKGDDSEISVNYHRMVRAFVVDLIYFGDEKKAWEIFDQYYPENYQKDENRAEIKKILRKSRFYQALKRNK